MLKGATTHSQSGSVIDGNEGVLWITQSSNITGASVSDSLVSYAGYSLGEEVLPPQLRCSSCILQPQPTGLE